MIATELQVIAPLIVAVITVFGGMATYLFQRRTDRRNQIVELRRQVYRNYIESLMDQISPGNSQSTLIALQKREMDLFVVASDRVIRCFAAFSNYMTITSYENIHLREAEKYKGLYSSLLLAMRRDCFEKSSLNEVEAVSLLPMG